MSSLIGRKLGKYKIIELLGKGGMATVYLGEQDDIGRRVAVKVLPPHPGLDEQFKDRFQLEARTIGSLQNPHILPLYDYGTQDDILYLVMAYIEGGTLEDFLDSGPPDIDTTERIIREIARGLDYAHRKGVVHRDIKPANILMQEGHPLLADFGMVKMVASSANLTGTAVVGTPAYMPPEQGQGLPVDKRADIYALGAVAYEMLAGMPPFKGDTPMQTILAHINEPVPDIRDVRPNLPEELSAVLQKALSKEPAERYQSAGEFAEAFSTGLHGDGDTLANVRRAYPVEREETASTVVLDEPPQREKSQQSTVIVREGTNPLLLLAGFGLIALVIVVVAIAMINRPNVANPLLVGATSIMETSAAITEVPADATSPAVVAIEEKPNFGELRFSSNTSQGDTVTLRLSRVRPPRNQTYAAWLTHTETGDTLSLGRVVVDAVGEGGLVYTDAEGRMLAANYNAVLITLEDEIGAEPSEAVYSGSVPQAVSQALTEIFVASEQGIRGGSLLDGILTEARTASQHAGLAARANNIGGVRSHAEHTINILRGESVDYNGSGRGENPGRGIGVYFFLEAISGHLNDIVTQPDASLNLQTNAELIRVCAENVRLWSDRVVELESEMIASETIEAATDAAAESTQLMEHVVSGFDANENGIIEPFEGECGLQQIPEYGVQFANMNIFEGEPQH